MIYFQKTLYVSIYYMNIERQASELGSPKKIFKYNISMINKLGLVKKLFISGS